MILSFTVLAGFFTPWQWLLRGVVVFGVFVLHLLILDAQTPCGEWGCGSTAVIVVIVFAGIGGILFLRYLMILVEPALAMNGVGAMWLWLADLCVAVGCGSIVGQLIFTRLIWAGAGANGAAAHFILFGVVFLIVGVSTGFLMRFSVRYGGVGVGVALMLFAGAVYSTNYPTWVLEGAEGVAGAEHCIYFPISDRFYAEAGELTFHK